MVAIVSIEDQILTPDQTPDRTLVMQVMALVTMTRPAGLPIWQR